MGYDYTKKLQAVGQVDTMSCWAACISWWTQAMALNVKRRGQTQLDLIGKFMKYMGDDGGVSPAFLKKIGADAEVRMTVEYITAAKFKEYTDLDSPVVVVFKYPVLGGTHMNVIFNQSGDTVSAMEPFYPLPGEDGKRTGKYERRSLSFYCNTTEVGVGYLPLADAFEQDQ